MASAGIRKERHGKFLGHLRVLKACLEMMSMTMDVRTPATVFAFTRSGSSVMVLTRVCQMYTAKKASTNIDPKPLLHRS